jgi:hypothetical protein
MKPYPDYPTPTITCGHEVQFADGEATKNSTMAYFGSEKGGDIVTPVYSLTDASGKGGCTAAVFKGSTKTVFNGAATVTGNSGRGTAFTLERADIGKTYTGLSVDVTCKADKLEPKTFPQSCGNLQVTERPSEIEGGNVGNCAYRWGWCNNWPLELVKKGVGYVSAMQNVCYFVESISRLAVASTGNEFIINNVKFTNSNVNNVITAASLSNAGIEPKDGGYYIWIPDVAVDGAAKFTVTPGTPDCTPGEPTNAVSICKNSCGGSAVTPTIVKDKEYELRLYGQTACNVRHRNGGSNTCSFELNGGAAAATPNDSEIYRMPVPVNGGTPLKIKYTGGSCSASSVELYCP